MGCIYGTAYLILYFHKFNPQMKPLYPNILFFIFCCLVYFPIQAQIDLPPNGIYSSYGGFAAHNPVPQVLVSIKKRIDQNQETEQIENRTWISVERIAIETTLKLRSVEKRNMKMFCWGFCDGNGVYISSRNYAKFSSVRFSKILYLGKNYSYFLGAKDLSERSAGFIGGLLGTIPINEYYAIDMTTGKCITLEDKGFEDILLRYPSLYKEYKENSPHLNTDEKLRYMERLDSMLDE